MKLLDYCEISNKKVLKYDGEKKYIATGDLEKNLIVNSTMVTFENKPSRANLLLNENELLFAKMKNTNKVLIGNLENINNIYSTGFYCLKTKDSLFPKFLYYYLNSQKFNFQKDLYCSGATMKSINDKGLNKIEVEFPSKEEQLKLIKLCDNIYKMIDIKSKMIKDCNDLINSKYIELFGNDKDSKYEIVNLADVTSNITDGVHSKPKYTEKGIPFISVKDITTGTLKFDDCKYISKEDSIIYNKRCNPEKNDILYTKVGATYGRSAIINTNDVFSLYVSVCLIKPQKEIIDPMYLNYTMSQPYVKAQADKSIKGIGVPDLHLVEIKKFKIILPPMELQKKFSDFAIKIDKLKQVYENEIIDLNNMFNSIINKYIK
ncbi:MAG: restriction endonuclease subunit S [Erysipelotrichaceae bacterium]|nr:restriction endonuclease subunit S [Bacilli bacterium]MCI6266709.1 restriction endonuclease subunit S [Erysipelotrichaceae bacterium]